MVQRETDAYKILQVVRASILNHAPHLLEDEELENAFAINQQLNAGILNAEQVVPILCVALCESTNQNAVEYVAGANTLLTVFARSVSFYDSSVRHDYEAINQEYQRLNDELDEVNAQGESGGSGRDSRAGVLSAFTEYLAMIVVLDELEQGRYDDEGYPTFPTEADYLDTVLCSVKMAMNAYLGLTYLIPEKAYLSMVAKLNTMLLNLMRSGYRAARPGRRIP